MTWASPAISPSGLATPGAPKDHVFPRDGETKVMANPSPALKRLDGERLDAHAFFRSDDDLGFFHDYHSGLGRLGGPGNRLILDLKAESEAVRITP